MGIWGNIFNKKKNMTGDNISSFMNRLHCIRCGAMLPSQNANKCTICGHDQRVAVKPKLISVQEMAGALVSGYGSKILRDALMKEIGDLGTFYGKRIDQQTKAELYSLFLLTELALATLVCGVHYRNHPKHDQIIHHLKVETDDHLVRLYGKENVGNVTNYFSSLQTEYSQALQEQNYLESLSKVLQYRAESIILGVPLPGKEFAMPSIHAFANYLCHFTARLPTLEALFNKWDIK